MPKVKGQQIKQASLCSSHKKKVKAQAWNPQETTQEQ